MISDSEVHPLVAQGTATRSMLGSSYRAPARALDIPVGTWTIEAVIPQASRSAARGGSYLPICVTSVLLVALLSGCGAAFSQTRSESPRSHTPATTVSAPTPCQDIASALSCPLTQLSLIVLPHPDDSISAWSMIENRPSSYKVFIDLTQGESEPACQPRVGPSVYNRTASVAGRTPGSDPPGGWYLPRQDPWVGTVQRQISQNASLPNPACRQARFGSQVSFITSMASTDPSLPSFSPAPPTEWCFANEPNGKDPCMEVLASSKGAVISFDLGDMDWCTTDISCGGNARQASGWQAASAELAAHPYALQPVDVAWAVQNVVTYASTILPVSLPVGNIIAGGFLNWNQEFGTMWNPSNAPAPAPQVPYAGTCQGYSHPQHWVDDMIVRNWILVPNVPQYVRTCSGDNFSVFQTIDPTIYRQLMGSSSDSAIDGQWPLNWGWLNGTELDPPAGPSDPLEICATSITNGVAPAEGLASCAQAFVMTEGPSLSVDYASPAPPQVDPQGPWDYSHGNWAA